MAVRGGLLALAGALFIAIATALALPTAAATKRLIIGTGAVTGVYYAAGQAICRLVDRERAKNQILCRVEATPGSIANLRRLRAGTLDMAIAQSDWQHHAWNGTSGFAAAGADRKLRSVLSLHREAFTVLARPDSGIARLSDLKGKRINAGERGSGHRATVSLVFRALGWRHRDFALVLETSVADQAQALCDNRVDATLLTVGHPNLAVAEAMGTCQARLIPVESEPLAALVSETPYFEPAVIRPGTYRGQRQPIPTFGTTATLVATADLLPETVYDTVRAVFANLRALRRMHPALESLEAGRMAREGIVAPLHDGALLYYRERRLLPETPK